MGGSSIPPNLGVADEGRHASPEGNEGRLYGDTLWVSVVDIEANVFGVNHWHLSNKGWGRFEALYVIDGVPQLYANKAPLPLAPDAGPWSDGNLTYEVVEPYEHVRIQMDGPRFGFDLDFTGRFATFDYGDSVRGDPLAVAYPFHSGHYEQAMSCTGSFEIRGGPAEGETRRLDSWSHRDHTWSDRFAEEPEWEYGTGDYPGHYWPSIQTADRHINVFGLYFLNEEPEGNKVVGGFESTAAGSRPMLDAKAWIDPPREGSRRAHAWTYELTLPDGDVIHVATTKHHGTIKLWNRAENDVENRMDCYEAFVELEIAETGEQGYGVAEYSVYPPLPRWLI